MAFSGKELTQVGSVTTDSNGEATFTFPVAFTNVPVCNPVCVTSDTTKDYNASVKSKSKNSVTIRATATTQSVNILSLGLFTLVSNAVGVTVDITASSPTG